jgi:hypothetical protein
VLTVVLQADNIKWTDVMMAWGTLGAAIATTLAVGVALYIAAWLAPRLADESAKRVEERQRHRDDETEDRRFRAAALLVYDELRANLSLIEIAVKTSAIPEQLSFETYADYQLLLAQHLSPDDRDDVRAAYVYARVPRVFIKKGTVARMGGSEPLQPEDRSIPENVEAARKKTERAIVVLGWVAQKLPGGYADR